MVDTIYAFLDGDYLLHDVNAFIVFSLTKSTVYIFLQNLAFAC